MAAIEVAIVNKSTRPDAEVERVTSALQRQLRQDFCPAWGIDANVVFLRLHECVDRKRECHIPPGWWWLIIADAPPTPEPGVFGRHGSTCSGLPAAIVYADTADREGRGWTVTASHELLEMLVNPWDNQVAIDTDQCAETFYVTEVVDPCQASTYEIEGVEVSCFVYPLFFVAKARGLDGVQLAHPCSGVRDPFTPVEGGYMERFQVGSGTGWRILKHDGQTSEPLEEGEIGESEKDGIVSP